MQPGGGWGLQSGQEAMQAPWTKNLASFEPGPQRLVARREGREAVEQCPQVEPSSAHHDRQFSTASNLRDRGPGEARIITGGVNLFRLQDVEQMMRDAVAFGGRGFGRADVETAVELERVAVHQLARVELGQVNGEIGLTGSRGASDDQKWMHPPPIVARILEMQSGAKRRARKREQIGS